MKSSEKLSRVCSIPDCGSPVNSRGWCNLHYKRWMVHGDPLLLKWNTPTCSVDGCGKKRWGQGFCNLHYKRWYKYGDITTTLHAPPGDGYVRADGYRMLQFDRHKVLEHRYVMEKVLGRPLRPDEIIHHKDGNPLNNHPDNLQIMTQSTHMILHSGTETGCKRGHPWTEKNTYRYRGVRSCRTCKLNNARARRQRAKGT